MNKLSFLLIVSLLIIMKTSLQAQIPIIPKPQESKILKGISFFLMKFLFQHQVLMKI